MLYLVGLGLWDEKDISLRGLELAKSAARVYLEEYTSMLKGTSRAKLERMIGREVTPLGRGGIEESPQWLDEAKNGDVVLLVGGDPLVATTHTDLLMRAWELGIETRVVHNASIYSAVAECGLQVYKFGKTATVTFWEKNYEPTSFYDVVRDNSARGLHTLLLLDIRPDRQMSPNEAIATLVRIDPGFAEREIVVVSRVGGDTSVSYGKASALGKLDFGPPLHVIVVPGELHVMEKAFLSHFRKG